MRSLLNGIKTIIFDLDDTLLDTWGLLVAPAAREACQAMVVAGLDAELEEAISVRLSLFQAHPRQDVYVLLCKHFGVRAGSSAATVSAAGQRAYFFREVEDIALDEEVRELLEQLQHRYELYLVTSGHPYTQRRKVALLGIEQHFKAVIFVDQAAGQTKGTAFEMLLHELQHPAKQALCVGDRPDREIKAGKALGMVTARICSGEFKHLVQLDQDEVADFQLDHVTDLPHLLSDEV